MLDFVFDSKKYKEEAIVIMLNDLKELNDQRIAKSITKSAQETLVSATKVENLKNEAGSLLKTYYNDAVYFIYIVDDKNPFKTGKSIYNFLKKYENAVVLGLDKFKSEFVENVLIAMENANYSFDKYRTKKKSEDFDKLETVYLIDVKKPNMEKVTAITNAVRYARDLGNEPANSLTPDRKSTRLNSSHA